jgi:membrane dipeptidase
MREAWEIALKILKPNQRDLKRGLEIHADSIVIDAYGFAPRSAIDGDRVKAAIEEGASNIEIRDMIEDMETTRCLTLSTAKAGRFLLLRRSLAGFSSPF